MIKTRKDLKEYLDADLVWYYELKNTKSKKFKSWLSYDTEYVSYSFTKKLRLSEYFKNKSSDKDVNALVRIFFRICYLLHKRPLNKMRAKYYIYIDENVFEKGMQLVHYMGVGASAGSKIGENCIMHGENTIGTHGEKGSKSPVIGNNVEFGFGAKAFGDIYIADGIKIGAGSLVLKSFTEPGITIVGSPARKLEPKNK